MRRVNSFIFRLIFLSVIWLKMVACGPENPLDVDVSDIQVDLHVVRADQELFSKNPQELRSYHEQMLENFPELWSAYLQEMVRCGVPGDSFLLENLDRFVHDEVMKDVVVDIDSTFGDFSNEKRSLEDAFRHLRFYYPEPSIPKILTYNSVFNFGVYTTPDAVGIGLEMYLGADNEIVKKISPEVVPNYIKRRMRKEYLPLDVMRGWFEMNFMEEIKEVDFLQEIIYQGKIMYAMDALFPKSPDSLKIRYSDADLEWVFAHEEKIWRDVVDKKLLYSKDPLAIQPYIIEAPFTSGLPQNSPDRVGVWLGWQMVRAYMKENPQLKLPDLIKEKNSQKILRSYEPKSN